jgi:hypothetical protein
VPAGRLGPLGPLGPLNTHRHHPVPATHCRLAWPNPATVFTYSHWKTDMPGIGFGACSDGFRPRGRSHDRAGFRFSWK